MTPVCLCLILGLGLSSVLMFWGFFCFCFTSTKSAKAVSATLVLFFVFQAANQGAKFKGRVLQISWYKPKTPSVTTEPEEEEAKDEDNTVLHISHKP